MRRTSLAMGMWLGLVSTLPVLGVLYAGEAVAGLPYVPYLLFEWLTRILPGPLVTFGIDLMVGLITAIGIGPTSAVAKIAEMALAVAGMFLGAAFLGAALVLVGRRRSRALLIAGALAGAGLSALTLVAMLQVGFPPAGPAASTLWLLAVLVAWGTALGAVVARASAGDREPETRRRFLEAFAGGALALFAVTAGLGRWVGRRGRGEAAGGNGSTARIGPEATTGPAASPSPQELAKRIAPASPTRPELTDPDRFYRIDINLAPPELDEASWRLKVSGLVTHPQDFTLDELRALPAVSQVITLECISNLLGGDLISTGVVTGVPLRDFLARVGRQPDGRFVHLESADGFHETVEPQDIDDPRTLLVWALGGAPLTAEHGFPLRIYIPNRFGMKQPKWITRLEVAPAAKPGYWVQRGWSERAEVQTTAVIDGLGASMMLGEAQIMPVGGVAYSGAKGISKVEVQVDDGPWQEVQLRRPPLSPLSWVQWRFDWPYQPGRHTFRARAYDGAGRLQPTELRSPRPDGATGIFELTKNV